MFTKGAPDVLLARCSFEVRRRRAAAADARAPRGDSAGQRRARRRGAAHARRRRPLAVGATRLRTYAARPDQRVEQDLVFAGLIGMIDPPRPEAKEAVARAKRAGIRPLMITGDHPRTAAVIAQELGIADDGRAITGAELEKLSEAKRSANGRRGLGLRARQPRTQAAHRRRAAAERARSWP